MAAHNCTIWAVRIYLPSVLPEDTSIGLYTPVAGNSELRWVESAAGSGTMSGADPTTWCTTMLAEAGIAPIEEVLPDAIRMGGQVAVTGTTITAVNTDRLALTLLTYDTPLTGCKIEVYEFTWSETTGEVSRDVIFTGVLENPQWNESILTVDAVTNQLRRRANIATIISNDATGGNYTQAEDSANGEIVPVTFGYIDKAEMRRMAYDEVTATNQERRVGGIGSGLDPLASVFPVISVLPDGSAPTLSYDICLGLTRTGVADPLNNVIGKYLLVVSGTNSNGQYRAISAKSYSGTTMTVTVASYYEKTLIGNATATATGNAWVKIIDIDRLYKLDIWPCKAFMSADTVPVEITTGLDLFAYSDPKKVTVSGSAETVNVQEKEFGYYPLPKYAYTETAGTDHNSVQIDSKLFNSTPDDMDSFRIVPFAAADISMVNDSNLDVVGYSAYTKFPTIDYLYSSRDAWLPGVGETNFTIEANFDDAVDKVSTTYTRLSLTTKATAADETYAFCVKMSVPTLPTDFDYDSAYLMITYKNDHTAAAAGSSPVIGSTTKIASKRFMGSVLSPDIFYKVRSTTVSAEMNDSYDDYFTDAVTDNFKYFYSDYDKGATGVSNQFGYMNYEIDSDELKSGAIKNFYIFSAIEVYGGSQSDVNYFDIYEVAIILRKTASIKSKTYTGIRGRIFNDQWVVRKTSANLMTSPVDLIEHCARLQNWSDQGDNNQWGLEYSNNALVKITGAGSFDDATLGPIGGTDVSLWRPHDLTAAGQILAHDQAYTDEVMRKLARLTWCALRQDQDGYECIHYMPDTTTPTEAIDLTKIVGKVGDIIEPQTSDIYCAPIVRYNYNYGSGKYDGIIEIKNPNDPGSLGYQTTYSPGATETGNLEAGMVDGRVIWNQCAYLWSKYKQIEIPPTELTDLPFVRNYTTALWYLYQWVLWQGKRAVSIEVPYNTGKSYYCGMRCTLSLPHQTNSQALQCLLISVRKDKGNGTVSLTLLLLQEPTAATIYQDTDAGSVPAYQDTDAGGVTKWQNYDQ